MTLPVLHLSYDADLDWLEASPLGVVMDRQGHDRWRGVTERVGYFLDAANGEEIGFKVTDLSAFDAGEEDHDELFTGPRFDAPVLGLSAVTAGEVILACVPFLDGESTIDRVYFAAAMGEQGTAALALWRAALQAGNCMAHYGAGYTLLELGRHHLAYRHLRAYTELVPRDPWAWTYRARAAAGLGERAEAITCCRRAIELESVYGEETDAGDLLEELGLR